MLTLDCGRFAENEDEKRTRNQHGTQRENRKMRPTQKMADSFGVFFFVFAETERLGLIRAANKVGEKEID